MFRTRVKICGITRIEDLHAAAAAGADAVGLVFYPGSPRAVSAARATELVRAAPPFLTVTGLFVNPTADEVREVLEAAPLDMLQFHGEESERFCASFRRPYMKAVRMREGVDLAAVAREFPSARGLLLDTWVAGVAGGTGVAFDWTRVPRDLPCPVVLAGGLDPDNVAAAISQARPWAVDVSGGVEERDANGKTMPGIKSASRIRAFMRGVDSVPTV